MDNQFAHLNTRAHSMEDRKRAEETLRLRELGFILLVESIPVPVAVTTPLGEVEALNRPTLQYFGKTLEELKGWKSSDVVHPDDLQRTIAAQMKAHETGTAYDVESRHLRFDGVYRWFNVMGLPLRDSDGHILCWFHLLIDIDDRKKAEQALHSNERNLSLIINTMPLLAWSAGPDGSADFLNQRWLDYTGMPAEQARGLGWTGAIHPEDSKGLVEDWKSSLATGAPLETEARMRRFDGSFRWFLFRANALRDESGSVVKWYGTSIEIEDRKQREESLRARELSWRQIIDNIPGYVHTTTATGEVEFHNRQTLEYFGKTKDELKDWTRNDIVHPDDLPRVIEAWRKSVETGQNYEMEQRNLRADGVYRWFQARARPVRNAENEITAWYWLLIDIEDRKQAEAQVEQAYLRLAEAQRLSKTGSFITDLLVDEHNWSEETFRIFEFDPTTKVSVQKIRDVVHPEDLPSFDAVIARDMTGTDVDFAFRIVTYRGTVKHLRGMARLMAQSGGRPMFIGALQDVTESKAAEEALDRARSELARMARVTTLNALTASIAHEVNQPLSGMMTNASTCLRMLDGDPPNVDGARETARRSIRDGNRASDVIKRVRALFSKEEFTPEPLNLNDATREVIALSLSDLQRNRVVLRSELDDDLAVVTGDRIQLQQVILNLLRNASDAMSHVEDRPRELLVTTDRDAGGRVRLTVKDVGVGFTPETADKLFEAFYTTKSDGMGIGLSISRSIIEAHRGRLWATANDGPGATFSFSIPCGHADIPAAHTAGAD